MPQTFQVKISKKILLSVASGLLLWASWPTSGLAYLSFIAFIPLLFLSQETHPKNHFFLFTFLSMLIWNATTTWWIWNSTAVGAVAAIIANSLLMCIPWLLYYNHKKYFSSKLLGQIYLVGAWLSFEYIHLHWQLSWPWLTLGNVFASNTNWIQWYEYTGVSGGSLWVWIVNLLLFQIIQHRLSIQNGILTALSMGAPILFSYVISNNINTSPLNKHNIIVVQPNIDPYQKFEISQADKQIQQLIDLSASSIDQQTALIVWPETAMSVGEWQDAVPTNAYYQPIFQFAKQHPTFALVTGIETYKNYGSTKATASARKMNSKEYYDAFNAAVLIDSAGVNNYYYKSKLVPGVETLPSFLNFLAPVFEQFGGTTGGYGTSDSVVVLKNNLQPFIAAPIICYESIYGEYVTQYIKKGANVLTIITNDGWWGNTPGHKQHLAYAKLRAIETRRFVARSANTGISAFINSKGEITHQLGWNEKGFLKASIPLQNTLTCYVQFGDVLFKMGLMIWAILFLTAQYQKRWKKNI